MVIPPVSLDQQEPLSPHRKHTLTSRVGSFIAPPPPPPVSSSSSSFDPPNLLDEEIEDVHIQESIISSLSFNTTCCFETEKIYLCRIIGRCMNQDLEW